MIDTVGIYGDPLAGTAFDPVLRRLHAAAGDLLACPASSGLRLVRLQLCVEGRQLARGLSGVADVSHDPPTGTASARVFFPMAEWFSRDADIDHVVIKRLDAAMQRVFSLFRSGESTVDVERLAREWQEVCRACYERRDPDAWRRDFTRLRAAEGGANCSSGPLGSGSVKPETQRPAVGNQGAGALDQIPALLHTLTLPGPRVHLWEIAKGFFGIQEPLTGFPSPFSNLRDARCAAVAAWPRALRDAFDGALGGTADWLPAEARNPDGLRKWLPGAIGGAWCAAGWMVSFVEQSISLGDDIAAPLGSAEWTGLGEWLRNQPRPDPSRIVAGNDPDLTLQRLAKLFGHLDVRTSFPESGEGGPS